MKYFWCVTTVVFDTGKLVCSLDEIQADTKPEATYQNTRTRDIYKDYFDTQEEAEEFMEESRDA